MACTGDTNRRAEQAARGITFDATILSGLACTRGMRIPVSLIVGQIARGATVEQVLADYPDLEEQDVRQAVQYAAWLTQS